jgi:3-phosphoshikimate 1-carboxyvinyltransferase
LVVFICVQSVFHLWLNKMALPDLIEIVPLDKPVRAEITVPGSKSITNRAMILAALADGEVTLKGALWSEDTEIMFECLHKLGFEIRQELDLNETCNRTITVKGLGGRIPAGGTETQPLELFVGNAGTAARFLAPFLCLGSGVYRLHGVKRMHERPQAALFSALRELGYRVECENGNDKLPAIIWGGRACSPLPADASAATERRARSDAPYQRCTVSIEESSQFASALLLSAKVGGWEIEIIGENADESPYVAMTSKLMEVFPKSGGVFQIEPDASSGSYFLAVAKITGALQYLPYYTESQPGIPSRWINIGDVKNWPKTGWQIDQQFKEFLAFGPMAHAFLDYLRYRTQLAESTDRNESKKTLEDVFKSAKPEISRKDDLGDSIMTAITVAPVSDWYGKNEFLKFTDLGRLRVQECERVVALRTELTKCGAKVVEEGDTLTVYPAKPGELHGAEIETYNDHRMAMCFAILGLKVPGIKIKNPACVKKTFPNFFQKLAAPPPHGLGAEIWEVKDGQRTRKLSGEELFAD